MFTIERVEEIRRSILVCELVFSHRFDNEIYHPAFLLRVTLAQIHERTQRVQADGTLGNVSASVCSSVFTSDESIAERVPPRQSGAVAALRLSPLSRARRAAARAEGTSFLLRVLSVGAAHYRFEPLVSVGYRHTVPFGAECLYPAKAAASASMSLMLSFGFPALCNDFAGSDDDCYTR
jgi:hypothetical protein